jgi:hypothetical protein
MITRHAHRFWNPSKSAISFTPYSQDGRKSVQVRFTF